ncbi:MAG: nuclear transport factor 2 family protein [Myxococcota bacterium]|nr:nuclear transport factor 2 family protein [Myxococcota bacterium]
MKEADSNIEAVSRAFTAIANGDIDAAVKQLDANAKWDVAHALPEGGHYQGVDAIREMLRRQRQRFGSYKLLHTTVHGDANTVFFEYTRSPNMDEHAKGSEHCIAACEMAMGKVREIREFVHRA